MLFIKATNDDDELMMTTKSLGLSQDGAVMKMRSTRRRPTSEVARDST